MACALLVHPYPCLREPLREVPGTTGVVEMDVGHRHHGDVVDADRVQGFVEVADGP
jgi:hypothetical protein